MSFIYHGVPDQMVGTEIVPLNQMSVTLSEIHKLNLSKYSGREEILKRRIPLLNCLWNDVSQFLPLHPKKVFELQVKLGLIPEVPHYKFYEIDLSLLDPEKTVVFFKDKVGEENIKVEWLKNVDIENLKEIPKATEDYYKSLVGTGELPFNYQFIPHILYMDSLDISGSKIITLR